MSTTLEPAAPVNAQLLRRIVETDPWVAGAVEVRCQQIALAEPSIQAIDATQALPQQEYRQLRKLIDWPNKQDSWPSLLYPVARDLVILGEGVMVKVKPLPWETRPGTLGYADAARIAEMPQWSGAPTEPRYTFSTSRSEVSPEVQSLCNDEVIVITTRRTSEEPPVSPVRRLYHQLNAALAATTDKLNVAPVTWTGGLEVNPPFPKVYDAAYAPFWHEWLAYFLFSLCWAFEMPREVLGLTAYRKEGLLKHLPFEDGGRVSLLLLIEEYMNRSLIADFAPRDQEDRPDLRQLNLCYRYPEISDVLRREYYQGIIRVLEERKEGTA